MPKDPSPAQTFGHYTLLEELGRGGQGTVWLAEDQNLKRKVALKLLRTAAGTIDDHQLERFRREAEAASKLDHPNICALFDAGEVDGVPYIAFRHIDGETLAERVTAAQEHDNDSSISKEGIQTTVALFEKLARALHKAHEQGLIHRDVKPGNIMLTPDGEPMVLDFGLARDELADEHTLTHSGDLLGTPAYMSPEQLMAQRVPLDRRTDVYSLGATLYECLTLQRPFGAPTRAELYQQILHRDPSSVSSTNRQIPRDLQVIVETAMEKDRDRRYQTAQDLAEDLRRFREFEPIKARPIGRLLRTKRWAQRHPVTATGVLGAFLTLMVGLGVALWFIGELDTELQHMHALALASTSAEVAPTNPKLALKLAVAGVKEEERRETVSQLLAALSMQHEREVLPIRLPASRFHRIDLSPDRESILIAASRTVQLVKFDGELLQEFDHNETVHAAVFSPDGKHVLTACDDHVARLWDVQQGVEIRRFEGHTAAVRCCAFSPDFHLADQSGPDQGRVLTGSLDGTAKLWPLDGTSPRTVSCTSGVRSVLFSPAFADDRRFLTAAMRQATWWNADDDGSLATLDHKGLLMGVHHAPSSDRILTAGANGAHFWDRKGRRTGTIPGFSFKTATLSPDEQLVLTASPDLIARVYDPLGRVLVRLAGHQNRVLWAGFLPREDEVLTESEDGTLRRWDLSAPGFPVFRGHTRMIQTVTFSPEGDHLLSAAEDGTARLWPLAGGPPVVLEGRSLFWRSDFSPQGDVLVTASGDGSFRLWDRSWQPLSEAVRATEEWLTSAEFSPGDGEWILTSSFDKTARLWTREGSLEQTFVGHEGGLMSAKFSPRYLEDGRIVTASSDFTARVWQRDGSVEAVLKGHTARVRWAEFSPAATRIVTACMDGTVRLWDLAGVELWKFDGHEGPVHSAEFSPTGNRIVTASRDKTARILDLQGNELLRITSPSGFFMHATFSPDGKLVATAGRTVRVWPIKLDDMRELADKHDVEFTASERMRFSDLLPVLAPK